MEGLQCSWRHCLSGLLVQLLLAICFFSYLRVSWDCPKEYPRPEPSSSDAIARVLHGSPALVSTPQPSTPQNLLILLWTWPFNNPVPLSRCSDLRPGTADCQITANRKVYRRADAVIVHHWEVGFSPKIQLPPSPRPTSQRWVWFTMEPPENCPKMRALDGLFNLTMSYRSDSDIFTPYGWLVPRGDQPIAPPLNLSAKTGLVAWAVSNWREGSARVRYYNQLRLHLPVDVYGKGHRPLPRQGMQQHLAQYKFYLAFENSQHPDYITEKLWKNALQAPAVPVVLGPSRSNYERFLPPDAFIHVDDFPSPQVLAQHLLALDKDDARYLRFFRWRETLRVVSGSWALAFCKACWRLQEGPRYQTVASIATWFT
ncbi:galactoside 3(4)-L-fucosyltransferase-like [Octodon degus]|uniref:Fucosyltransferase n=1 Tax=Octodon degus TaxID=10160 RepID=A0A6P3FJT8_OCTDE|nr:galactoside 3(4)-L-fucosyltransferase-like [Octodon degus]